MADRPGDDASVGSSRVRDEISHKLLNNSPPPQSPPETRERRKSTNLSSEDLSPPEVYSWKLKHFLSKDLVRSPIFQLNGESFSLGFWPKGGMVKDAKKSDIRQQSAALSIRYEGLKEVVKCKVSLRIVCLRNPKYSQEATVDVILGCMNIQEPDGVTVQRSVGFERFVRTKDLLPENNQDPKTALVDARQAMMMVEAEVALAVSSLEKIKFEAQNRGLTPEKRAELLLARQLGDSGFDIGGGTMEDEESEDDMNEEIKIPKLVDSDMLGARLSNSPSTKALLLEKAKELKDEASAIRQRHLAVTLKPSLIRPVSSTQSSMHPLTQRPPRPRVCEEALTSSYLETDHVKRKLMSPQALSREQQKQLMAEQQHLEQMTINQTKNVFGGKKFQTSPTNKIKNNNLSTSPMPLHRTSHQTHSSSSSFRVKGDRCLMVEPNVSWKPLPGTHMGPGNALELPSLHDKASAKFRYRHKGRELSDQELLHIYQQQQFHNQKKQLEQMLASDPMFSNNRYFPPSSWHAAGIRAKPRNSMILQLQQQQHQPMAPPSSQYYYNEEKGVGVIGGNTTTMIGGYGPPGGIGSSSAYPPYQALQQAPYQQSGPYHYGNYLNGMVMEEPIPILGKVTMTLRPRSAEVNKFKEQKSAKITVSYESKPNTPGTFGFLDKGEEENIGWKSSEDVKLDLNISAHEACRKILQHMNQHRQGESKKFEEVSFIIRDARTGLEFDVDKKSRDQFFTF